MIFKFFHRFSLIIPLILAAGASTADQARDIDRLIKLLAFEETIDIMRAEGLRYGGELAGDMLPDVDIESWQSTVSRIYDSEKMLHLISQDFHSELSEVDLLPMLEYFSGEEGQEIIALELAARRAFLDPETEAEAQNQFEALQAEGSALVDQIEQVMTDSDLVEYNVMGTLNSSMMFYRGLSEGGAYHVSESDILDEVWSQEEETRRSSHDWLGAFLTMAYQPLDPQELEDYAAFFRTPSGRELNRAIFVAYDRMYEELSYLMGLAVADYMTSEPL